MRLVFGGLLHGRVVSCGLAFVCSVGSSACAAVLWLYVGVRCKIDCAFKAFVCVGVGFVWDCVGVLRPCLHMWFPFRGVIAACVPAFLVFRAW